MFSAAGTWQPSLFCGRLEGSSEKEAETMGVGSLKSHWARCRQEVGSCGENQPLGLEATNSETLL